MNNIYINIKDVAEAKGLKSTRSLRLELNKYESKYISREVQVNGGTSYEILISSLEPELQDKLRRNENKSTELVPLNYQPPQFISDQAKITANFRINIVLALIKFRKKYTTKKQADSDFLDLYNSGLYLPKAYRFIGAISIGTLHRWLRKYEKHECAECLQPNYKYTKQGEYNSNVGDVRNKTYINIIEKKTNKPKRFPINSKLKPMLDKFTADRKIEEPLFKSIFGNRMERTQCYRIINDACRDAGIDYKVGTHTLRKTFGYHHYQKFKDVAVLQKIFNHYSPQITMRYIGIDQDMIDDSYNNFVL